MICEFCKKRYGIMRLNSRRMCEDCWKRSHWNAEITKKGSLIIMCDRCPNGIDIEDTGKLKACCQRSIIDEAMGSGGRLTFIGRIKPDGTKIMYTTITSKEYRLGRRISMNRPPYVKETT